MLCLRADTPSGSEPGCLCCKSKAFMGGPSWWMSGNTKISIVGNNYNFVTESNFITNIVYLFLLHKNVIDIDIRKEGNMEIFS